MWCYTQVSSMVGYATNTVVGSPKLCHDTKQRQNKHFYNYLITKRSKNTPLGLKSLKQVLKPKIRKEKTINQITFQEQEEIRRMQYKIVIAKGEQFQHSSSSRVVVHLEPTDWAVGSVKCYQDCTMCLISDSAIKVRLNKFSNFHIGSL